MMKYCEDEIKTYVRDSLKCRRKMLLESVDVDITNLPSFETLISAVKIVKETANIRDVTCLRDARGLS